MLVSDRAVKFQALWNATSETPAPPLQLFMRWALKYQDETIERGILKTAAKFKFHKGTDDAVYQYAQALLKNLHEDSRCSTANPQQSNSPTANR
jgi:hypothetical protein